MKFTTTLLLALLAQAAIADTTGTTIAVNCNAGDTLSEAVARARPGTRILVHGTCHESVEIVNDRITITGIVGAVIDGGGGSAAGQTPPFAENGVVEINGAQGVRLENLTIRNGTAEGILAKSGAAFSAENLTVSDHAGFGVLVIGNSSAELTDTTVLRGGIIGIYVLTSSTALLQGRVSVSESLQNGIALDSGSSMEVRGGVVESTQNGQDGFNVADSTLRVLGAPQSEGTTLIARNNAGSGFFLAKGTLLLTGGGQFAGNFHVELSNNGAFGFLVPQDGSIVSPFASATFDVNNNPAGGLLFQGGSSALIIGGLNVHKNGVGLIADSADSLTLAGHPDNPSSIDNNLAVDIELTFGTHSTIDGVSVGSISCDDTVLSRGTVVCPVIASTRVSDPSAVRRLGIGP